MTGALFATLVLLSRKRNYRAMKKTEDLDADLDGVPDVFQVQKP